MDMRSLVDEFGQDVTVKVISGGGYVNGIYQEPTETTTTIFGVLLNLTYKQVQTLTSGEYTTLDKKLVVKDSINLKKGDIIVDTEDYTIEDELDQSHHGKIRSYIAKKVVG